MAAITGAKHKPNIGIQGKYSLHNVIEETKNTGESPRMDQLGDFDLSRTPSIVAQSKRSKSELSLNSKGGKSTKSKRNAKKKKKGSAKKPEAENDEDKPKLSALEEI